MRVRVGPGALDRDIDQSLGTQEGAQSFLSRGQIWVKKMRRKAIYDLFTFPRRAESKNSSCGFSVSWLCCAKSVGGRFGWRLVTRPMSLCWG